MVWRFFQSVSRRALSGQATSQQPAGHLRPSRSFPWSLLRRSDPSSLCSWSRPCLNQEPATVCVSDGSAGKGHFLLCFWTVLGERAVPVSVLGNRSGWAVCSRKKKVLLVPVSDSGSAGSSASGYHGHPSFLLWDLFREQGGGSKVCPTICLFEALVMILSSPMLHSNDCGASWDPDVSTKNQVIASLTKASSQLNFQQMRRLKGGPKLAEWIVNLSRAKQMWRNTPAKVT